MFTAIVLFVIIFIIYQIVKPKGSKPIKMSAFDAYLIEHHKKSLTNAKKINTIVPSNENIKIFRDTWADDLYLSMIKSGQYDTDSLRKEAMKIMNVTEAELDELLKN